MRSLLSSADAARNNLALARRKLLVGVLLAFGLVLVGCKQDKASAGDQEASAAPLDTLPFTVDSKVLYTWIKDDGSFQLSEKLDEIPAPSRKLVRIVGDGGPPGTPTHVFVADLGAAKAGDSVTAKPLSRAEWEANGLKFRQAKVEPLEKAAAAQDTAPPVMAAGKTAIVYGADWCGPCHQAEDYLKKLGMQVTKKNIEEDPTASSEMRAKLQRSGLGPSSSIPILDVAGTMLIGFSPRAIDAAIRAAK
jgi:glutaredoxin